MDWGHRGWVRGSQQSEEAMSWAARNKAQSSCHDRTYHPLPKWPRLRQGRKRQSRNEVCFHLGASEWTWSVLCRPPGVVWVLQRGLCAAQSITEKKDKSKNPNTASLLTVTAQGESHDASSQSPKATCCPQTKGSSLWVAAGAWAVAGSTGYRSH